MCFHAECSKRFHMGVVTPSSLPWTSPTPAPLSHTTSHLNPRYKTHICTNRPSRAYHGTEASPYELPSSPQNADLQDGGVAYHMYTDDKARFLAVPRSHDLKDRQRRDHLHLSLFLQTSRCQFSHRDTDTTTLSMHACQTCCTTHTPIPPHTRPCSICTT